MLRLSARIKLVVALMLTLVSSAYGQSPATAPDSQQKEVAVSESKPSKPENKADETKPKDLQTEVEGLKAENAAVREHTAGNQQIRIDLGCRDILLLPGPGKTVFQISINQVLKTLHFTIPTACLPSRPERLRRA